MKVRWNSEYTTRAVYIFLVCLAVIVVLMVFLNMTGIFNAVGFVLGVLSPFVWGFAVAYILSRPLNFFERRVFAFLSKKKPRPKLTRALSVLVCVLLLLALVAGIFAIILPSLIESVGALIEALPSYMRSFNETIAGWGNALNLRSDIVERLTLSWDKIMSVVNNYLTKIDLTVADISIQLTTAVVSGLVTAVVALVASIYMLYSKERFCGQAKKLIYAFVRQRAADAFLSGMRRTHKIFSNFITGKLLESLFVGVLMFIAMTVFGMPYALLISVIMGVFNIIPYFGPFIGAIPSALLLLMVEPIDALWFIIIVLVVQQIDGQLLGPKILGGSTGLAAFWVIFAIILGGGLGGVLGMILGIPVFAVLYSLAAHIINTRLKKKGLSTRSEDYVVQKTDKH